MGDIDIRVARRLSVVLKDELARLWMNISNPDVLSLFIIVLYQYLEMWTTLIIQNEHDSKYYINKEKIEATVSIKWVDFAVRVRVPEKTYVMCMVVAVALINLIISGIIWCIYEIFVSI